MTYLPMFLTIALIVIVPLFIGALIGAIARAASTPMPMPPIERPCCFCGQDGADITTRGLDGKVYHQHDACFTL